MTKQDRQINALARLKDRKYCRGRYKYLERPEGEELNRINREMRVLEKALGRRRIIK